jgi:soluble lytic murein transglycosylase-like protein
MSTIPARQVQPTPPAPDLYVVPRPAPASPKKAPAPAPARGVSLLPLSFIAAALVVGVLLLWFTGFVEDGAAVPVALPAPAPAVAPQVQAALPQASGQGAALSPIFTSEVRYWESDIQRWAAAYGFDPNLVATVMQIESCGNPHAVSGSGAQGLFQVMPFHFSANEDMQDPDTNATRGLNFLTEMLKQSGGHVGLALVGYNGGYRAVQGNWYTWAPETRRYYRWGAGIHMDAITGLLDSPTLHEWLDAGGAVLCQQAHAQLGLP